MVLPEIANPMVMVVLAAPRVHAGWWLVALAALLLLGAGLFAGYRIGTGRTAARDRALEVELAARTAELQREVERREEVEEMLRRREMEDAVASERSRIARDLHEAITQTLFSAGLIAEALPALWQGDPAKGHKLLEELRQLNRCAVAEMRILLLELRPGALVETDLGDLLRQLADAAGGRSGLPVEVRVEGHCDLPANVHIALYRIAQEALANVARHAQAHHAEVRLHSLMVGQKPHIQLTIHDDGRGFDPRVPAGRLGLGTMHERASAAGALLKINSAPGAGTTVTVLWPADLKSDPPGSP